MAEISESFAKSIVRDLLLERGISVVDDWIRSTPVKLGFTQASWAKFVEEVFQRFAIGGGVGTRAPKSRDSAYAASLLDKPIFKLIMYIPISAEFGKLPRASAPEERRDRNRNNQQQQQAQQQQQQQQQEEGLRHPGHRREGGYGDQQGADGRVARASPPVGPASRLRKDPRPAASTANKKPEMVREGAYRVWYATNRAPAGFARGGDVAGFSARRDPIGTTHYGLCDVFVPQSHAFGSIGSSALKRHLMRKDDRLKIVDLKDRVEATFWHGIREQLAASNPGKKQAVIFLHGYNVSFEGAALRAAQIGYDLGIEAMAFFSWPSQGKLTLTGYTSDGNSIEASEPAIADFLVRFASEVEADAIHVIAHSMGNRGLMRAVARISAEAERRSHKQFDNFVLAAADVDADTFRGFASDYAKVARRTTLYVSRKDQALRAAKFLSSYDRIGYWPPVAIMPGMDTISVSDVDMSVIGHGFIAELAPVLADVHQLFTSDLPPSERFRLKEVVCDAGRYWSIHA